MPFLIRPKIVEAHGCYHLMVQTKISNQNKDANHTRLTNNFINLERNK